MKKRGQVSIQFQWIFVLIAGAVIFAFFVNVVGTQKEYSEVKTSGTISTNLESILTGAKVSTGTVNIIDIPQVDIEFGCDNYRIGAVSSQVRDVIFAPHLLQGNKIITWAQDWSVPYRVTNFLYLTSPQVRYIIIPGSSTNDVVVANDLLSQLPQRTEDENSGIGINADILTSLTSNDDTNNYIVKIILVGDADVTVPSGFRGSISMMRVKDLSGEFQTSNLPAQGTIEYLYQGFPAAERQYSQHEELFGAIFTTGEDVQSEIFNFDCVMQRAFRSMEQVTDVYKKRSETLASEYFDNNPACNLRHAGAANELSKLKEYSSRLSQDIRNSDDADWEGLKDSATTLTQENHRAELASCALIY